MDTLRFLRISRLIGEEKVFRLNNAFVVVVGLGAVGGYALEALARSGVGRFRLVDFDTIGITNINRQLLATESSIGRKKVAVACERVLDINPEARVEALDIFAHEDTLEAIFADNPDLVIDAIDSLTPKLALLEGAWKRQIPIISSMGAALRRDPALIQVGDLMDTFGCPLAKQVRTKLRRRGVERGILTVFSSEPVDYSYQEPEMEKH
ncbi:MAG: tRNA threonylcarbamoyladenosine dehydratase, partial [Spirochaetae bacterium HGW-Spirochaetae-8]